MSDQKAALDYHSSGRPGKIAVVPTKPCGTQEELSLAYTPGVAAPCLEIEKNPLDAYRYTAKGNLVAVITNGTAVLGLGDIGPLAGKPVMEGKGVLFKEFADIDVFDLEIDEKDPDKFIEIVRSLEPTFGGINLEDIKAPECFYIEAELSKRMKIPVFHDDQHGTAIITTAALINALELAKLEAKNAKVVFSGAGAAAVACAKMFLTVGIQKENVFLCDRQGVVTSDRKDLEANRGFFAQDPKVRTMAAAIKDSHIFVGLSGKGLFTPEMLATMAPNAIVFAMANPDPEIGYHEALAVRKDIIMATGRSDYPNQVNNVLGFPFVFRGALDVGATKITEPMKLAAAKALAALAREKVPLSVCQAYKLKELQFGADYIIPKPLDPRVLLFVAPAIAKAAMESGVATQPIRDFNAYHQKLQNLLVSKFKRDDAMEDTTLDWKIGQVAL
ncbi:MAG: malate dehydrogenase [Deltaproteobacteria bacterium]|nr:malate dehydrogenase [Deltaproteobacteria bacterium]